MIKVTTMHMKLLRTIITLYTLTSVCILSILFIHFLKCWQREFVMQSRACFVSDHFLYSYYLNMRFRADIVGRDYMLVTLRVKKLTWHEVRPGRWNGKLGPEGREKKNWFWRSMKTCNKFNQWSEENLNFIWCSFLLKI